MISPGLQETERHALMTGAQEGAQPEKPLKLPFSALKLSWFWPHKDLSV